MKDVHLNGSMLISGCSDRDHYDTQLLYFTCSSLGSQDAHPHAIYSHEGGRVFFNSRKQKTVNVYCVSAQPPAGFLDEAKAENA